MNEAQDFGGGIFVFGAGNCTIKEGVKIQNNKAQNGGGIYNDGGNLTIQGTETDKVIISGCKADSNQSGKKKGGGIYIAGGTVIIEHTSINGNTVGSSGEGKGIYVADGTFEMKAGAKIDENNDVYLKKLKKIKVETSALGDFGAKITPEKYPDSNTVITVLEASVTAACNDKFKVSDRANHTHWKVDKRGNLAQLVKKSSDSWTTLKNAVANAHQDAVIYIDGEIKASSSGSNFGAIEIKKPDDFTGGVDWKLTIMGLTGSDSDILNANYGTGGNITKHRIFKVYNGADFTIEGLTLKGADSGTKVGGAIYTEGKVEMANCVITENKVSAVRGGGVLIAGGTFTMIGGEIKNNKTKTNGEGGGVYINGGTFKMIGGLIKENNKDVTSKGKGVYIAGGSFTMSGSAKIDENNDVYLPTNRTIKILSVLIAEGTAAMINPQSYPSGGNNIKVLDGDITEGSPPNYKKFKVKLNGGTQWYVNALGNLTITEP